MNSVTQNRKVKRPIKAGHIRIELIHQREMDKLNKVHSHEVTPKEKRFRTITTVSEKVGQEMIAAGKAELYEEE